ncbi:PREDICTED: uncharacterized protein LOC108782891 [Cyphomyrmex costatus]|uniref:uncharacterized protein LOC108782891 n=1 Tax=Cyphomyrmex costatus TaxID=456900 RepID=UPI0008523D87|nr:PREDICTED: uncharacterized protein LOC108782891 [Cyphomyrmex costatus]
MLCRWYAVLVLAGIFLVIEAIAVSQGTFTRDQRVLSGSLVHGSRNVSGVPAFETNVPRNVTTAVGQTAFLHCRVYQLGDKEMQELGLPRQRLLLLRSGTPLDRSNKQFHLNINSRTSLKVTNLCPDLVCVLKEQHSLLIIKDENAD